MKLKKGNLIKNQLLEKGILKIHENKNENGWKKYIRLSSNSNSQSNSTNKLNQPPTPKNFN